jgi:methylmalonyl-CoA/ethylmalonyl-CoA epimerase
MTDPKHGSPYLGIDHLGIAVADLEEAVRALRDDLGFPVIAEEEVPEQKVHVVKLDAGGTDLELLASTDPEGPIGKFLRARGPGIHHVSLRVDDLERTLASLAARGVRLIDRTPRVGAAGKRIAFLHPKATAGVLIELCETKPATGAS